MKKQILIIGLGQFGMSLARTLCDKNFEVLAVDIDQNLVNEASNFATDAICMNATDETSLEKLSPKDRDIIICAISSKEASILTVALLKQMGCENIVARASEPIHSRILKAIGANCVINPELEYGKKFASKIMFQNVFKESAFSNIDLKEVSILPYMEGKTLIDLSLPSKYGLTVVSIIKNNEILRPTPTRKLEKDEILLIAGSDEDVEKLLRDNKA